jgi:hypothetical protein
MALRSARSGLDLETGWKALMLKLLALLGLLTMALMGGVTMILTLLSPP